MVRSDHPNKPHHNETLKKITLMKRLLLLLAAAATMLATGCAKDDTNPTPPPAQGNAGSHTHLRAHETRGKLVCRRLLEKKKKKLPITYQAAKHHKS